MRVRLHALGVQLDIARCHALFGLVFLSFGVGVVGRLWCVFESDLPPKSST